MPDPTCTIDGCAHKRHAKGLCSHHYNTAYYAANAPRERERAKAWYRENPEKVAAARARADKEAARQYARARYAALPLRGVAAQANCKAKRVGSPGTLTVEGLTARIAYFGGCCWICGKAADTIDHVKPFNAGGSNFHSNIRPACMSCNTARHDTWNGVSSLS